MKGRNGWLSPEGKFYACGFMGHNNVASLLGLKEEQMEKSWVKISDCRDPALMFERSQDAGSDFIHVPARGVTQSQFTAMELWCENHGRQLPPRLEVRE